MCLEYLAVNKYFKIMNQLGFLRFFEIWFATITVPFWLYKKDFASTLKYFDVKSDQRFDNIDQALICNCIVITTRKPWLMRDRRCLRQGLLAMRFLKKASFEPTIHFGVDINTMSSPSLSAHCWVEIKNTPVMNDILEEMIIVHSVPTPIQ